MTEPKGPTVYKPGDKFPCCGCPYEGAVGRFVVTIPDCSCRCHEAPKILLRSL